MVRALRMETAMFTLNLHDLSGMAKIRSPEPRPRGIAKT
jgi:hypothetical protein